MDYQCCRSFNLHTRILTPSQLVKDLVEANTPVVQVRAAGMHSVVAAVRCHSVARQSTRMSADSAANTAEAAATDNTHPRKKADWEEEDQAAEPSSWCQHAAGDHAGDGDGR